MKLTRLFFMVILFTSVLPKAVFSQTNTTVTYFKDWTFAAESPTNVDISYSTLQCCTNKIKVHI